MDPSYLGFSRFVERCARLPYPVWMSDDSARTLYFTFMVVLVLPVCFYSLLLGVPLLLLGAGFLLWLFVSPSLLVSRSPCSSFLAFQQWRAARRYVRHLGGVESLGVWALRAPQFGFVREYVRARLSPGEWELFEVLLWDALPPVLHSSDSSRYPSIGSFLVAARSLSLV